tara:strand:- start:1192 stop:1368 length:177 start_codon:yes stop_codon:yes gene_type:complete
MDDKEIKLECLRLAVQFGSARTVSDPVMLAQRYMDFVKSEDKPRAPRRKPLSKADQSA